MSAWVQQVWLCMKLKSLLLPRDHFASCSPHVKKIHLSNNVQSSVSRKKTIWFYNSWGNSFGAAWNSGWQLNWWPLNKYCLKLMLSNRPGHVYRRAHKKSQSNYSAFYLARCGLTRSSFPSICLSHFFSLTPSSSFLPTSVFVREN